MAEVDDGIRAKTGVVVCMRQLPDGRIRLVFDDVEAASANNPECWTPSCLFTWTQFDADKLSTLTLTEQEFAKIGFNLVGRLIALGKTHA